MRRRTSRTSIHALVVAGGIAALCSGCLVDVATNQNQPVAVAVDAGGVYWVAPGPVTDALTAGTAGRP